MNTNTANIPQNVKNGNILKKQKRVIIVLAVLAVILFVAYAIVSALNHDQTLVLPLFDEDGDRLDYTYTAASGNRVELVETTSDSITVKADSEITYNARPFIFPEIPLNGLGNITVKNASGEYTVILDKASGEHLFKGNEMLLYNEQALASLMFQARFMLAIQKVDGTYDTQEALSAFGLDAASNPVTVTVWDTLGNMHTVQFGDLLVTGAAYYAKDVTKPYVYVVDSSVSVFWNEENSFYDPIIVPTFSQSEYQYVDSFSMYKNGKILFDSAIIPEEMREGTGNTYLHRLTYPAGYNASFTKYYEALEYAGTLKGTRVLETGVLAKGTEHADAIFKKYELSPATNDVAFSYGEKKARFITGKRYTDADGNVMYFAYSPYMDTVVELPLASAPFLEYELIDFIDPAVFQMKIDNVAEITARVPGITCHFVLEGSGKDLKITETNTGKTVDTDSFRQFFISLLTIRIEGYAATEDVTGTSEFGFTVKSVYDEEFVYDFDIISTTRDLVTLNGSAEFYTNRSHVTTAAERLIKLARGEKIEAAY